MIRWMILKKLDSVERQLGASVDYVRHIVRTSLPAFFKFAKMLSVSQCRRSMPVEPYHVARIVATRDADCGTCVQVEVNEAKKAGVSIDTLRAVVDGNVESLPEELAEAYHFAESVIRSGEDVDAWREKMRRRYGDAGLIEVSMAIAACRFFPLLKRGLGYSTACAQTRIEI